jgi:broad specificity phosphatase PhoE
VPKRRRIYLMRHGAVRYFGGSAPVPARSVALSDEGRAQAEAARAALDVVPIDRVVTSTLPRARDTAAIVLGPRTDIPVQPVAAFDEISGGRLRDIPENELEAAFLTAFGPELAPEACFLRGESFGSLVDRVVPAFEQLCSDSGWGTLLLVAHGAVNRAILAHALGAGLTVFDRLEQDSGCINVLDVGDCNHVVIRLVNHTPYSPLKVGITLTTMELLYDEYRSAAAR